MKASSLSKSAIGLAFGLAGFAVVAGTCTWVGGTDYRWSTAANWAAAAAPTNGDDVVISSVSGSKADAHEIVNDIPGLTLASLTFDGTTAVTFEGEPLTIQARTSDSEYAVTVSAPTDCYVDMSFVTNGTKTVCRVTAGGNLVQYGDWNIADGVTLGVRRTDGATVDVYGAVSGPKSVYKFLSGGKLSMHGAVSLDEIAFANSDAVTLTVYSHDFKVAQPIQPGTYSTFAAKTPEAWQGFHLGLSDAVYGDHGSNRRIYDMKTDQTIARLFGGKCFVKADGTDGNADEASVYNSDGESFHTLTIKATQDDVTYACFRGKLDVTWAPVGDYVLELHRRTHKTTGTIFVKGGTLRLTDNTVFSSAAAVKVGKGATLDVTTAGAFGASVPLWVADGGRVILTNGNDLTVAKLYYKGLPVAAGSYDKATAACIVGDGKIVVGGMDDGNFWKAPVSGSWTDPTKWSKGTVPTAVETAYVTADGASDYTVTVSSEITAPMVFTLFSLGANVARVDVAAGGNWSRDVPSVEIGRNGEWRVSGGTIALTNPTESAAGYVNIAGDEGATGRVTVVSGTFDFCYDDHNVAKVFPGGAFLAQGGVSRFMTSKIYSGNPLLNNRGGRISFSGKARYEARSYTGFGAGEASFGGSAVFAPVTGYTLGSFGVNPSACQTATATLTDAAAIQSGGQDCYIGCHADAYGSMLFDSTATHPTDTSKRFATDVRVAVNEGNGRMELTKGAVVIGDYGLKAGSVDNLKELTAGSYGAVVVSGGFLDVRGCLPYGSDSGSGRYGHFGRIGGIAIGNAAYWTYYDQSQKAYVSVQPGRGHPYEGKMTVSDGRVELLYGSVTLGAGMGRGTWEQTGGVMTNKSSVVAVGLAGGIGRLALSGGVFSTAGDIYIGGAPTNAFTLAGAGGVTIGERLVSDGNYPIDRHDADGTVELSGGFLDASEAGVCLGADGTGTLCVNGTAGRFQAKTLVTAGKSAKLAFVADAAGVASLEAETATLNAGTRIDVDLTELPEGMSNVCLVRSYNLTADLDRLSVSFQDRRSVKSLAGKASLRLMPGGLYVVIPHGIAVIFW